MSMAGLRPAWVGAFFMADRDDRKFMPDANYPLVR
jgi:hypothetical protein